MKKLILLLVGCSVLISPAALAQNETEAALPPRAPNKPLPPPPPPKPAEVRFDLDFPGGTPAALVKAIEKSAGKPLNAIIPVEFANEQLPALRMKSVTVKDLFDGLRQSTTKTVQHQNRGLGGGMPIGIGQTTTSYGFRTTGALEYESIWYFYKEAPTEPVESKLVRFYNLAPYLETYKVEDITTAVQTGWKMLGESSPPVMNYHKDTKLLIVVGENAKLGLIDTVLSELGKYPLAKAPKVGSPVSYPPGGSR